MQENNATKNTDTKNTDMPLDNDNNTNSGGTGKRDKQGKFSSKNNKEDEGKTTKEKPKKQTGAYIYMGPNLLQGIFHGDTFVEIPTHFDELFAKLPELKELIIDCQKLPQYKKDLNTQGTEAHSLYNSVMVQVKEGVLEDGV